MRDRRLSSPMSGVWFFLIPPLLPAPGWICAIMPQGFHSSAVPKILPEPSDAHTVSSLILNLIRICYPDELLRRCVLSLVYGKADGRVVFFFLKTRGGCYRRVAAPPVRVEARRSAWARLRLSARLYRCMSLFKYLHGPAILVLTADDRIQKMFCII